MIARSHSANTSHISLERQLFTLFLSYGCVCAYRKQFNGVKRKIIQLKKVKFVVSLGLLHHLKILWRNFHSQYHK